MPVKKSARLGLDHPAVRMVPMFLVMGTIFFVSSWPVSHTTPILFPGADKIIHCTAYFVLGLSVIYGAGNKMRKRKTALCCVVIFFCCLYGISDELHQSFVPTRNPDIFDVFADVAGSILACGFWLLIKSKNR